METVKLGDITFKIGSGATPRGGKSVYMSDGVALVRSQNILDLAITRDGLVFIDDEAASKLAGATVEEGDVLINITGDSTARVALWDMDIPARVNQHVAILRPDHTRLNPRWLQYWLVQPRIKSHLLVLASSGASRPALTKGMLTNLKIPLPDLIHQGKVAAVLGALDDKIAANNEVVQRANTLSTAFMGIDFEESSSTPLKDVTSLIARGVTPRYDDAGGYTVLNQRCIRDSRVNVALSRTMKSLPKSPEKILRKNDVLVNSTGQGTLGRIARWISPDPNVAVDTHVSIVRFDPDLADPAFAGTILSTMERLVEDLAEGSTGQTELKRDLLGRLELNLPPLEKQRQVGQKITFLDELCHAHTEENTFLASTRDELLPLLMSGKITVREAKQEVAAAGVSVPGEESEA